MVAVSMRTPYFSTFYYNFFKKTVLKKVFWSFPLFITRSNVYLSKQLLKIRIESFQNNIFVELKIIKFYSI